MKALKTINNLALAICFLFYLTCYLRFIGQGFLCLIQMITAVFMTVEIYSKDMYEFKKNITIYWCVIISNLLLLVAFFDFIMWNDFFQFVFVTLIPNGTALYFYKFLTKIIDYETIENT